MEYSVEKYTVDIKVNEYIERFRNEKRFIELCKMCPNFGNSWACPPFDFDTENLLRNYKYAKLSATKIIPTLKNIKQDNTQMLIRPERIKIERELLMMEKKYGGRGFSCIGTCIHCNDGSCTRDCNKPCLHPDKVRPSLEAFGFDLEATLKELFELELKWSDDEYVPEYLILVSGFLHNQETLFAALS